MILNKSINWVVVLFLLVAMIGATTYNYDTGFYPGNQSIMNITIGGVWTNNTFNNSLSSENLTFSAEANITRYISVPENTISSSIKMNLTGYFSTAWTLHDTYADDCDGYWSSLDCVGLGYDGSNIYHVGGYNDGGVIKPRILQNDMDGNTIDSCLFTPFGGSMPSNKLLSLTYVDGYIWILMINYANTDPYLLKMSFATPTCTTHASYDISANSPNAFTMGLNGTKIMVIDGYSATNNPIDTYDLAGNYESTFDADINYGIFVDEARGFILGSRVNGYFDQTIKVWNLDFSILYHSELIGSGNQPSSIIKIGDNYVYAWDITDSDSMDIGNASFSLSYPTNPYLDVGIPDGVYDWNYSGELTTSQTTNNLADSVNTYLGSCVYSGGYCDVPFLFHSDSAGLLQYSDLDFGDWANNSIYLDVPSHFKDTTIHATMLVTGFNTSSALNPYIKIGNVTIWNYTGLFNVSENTTDFGEAIRLNVSSPVYLNLHAGSNGTIQFSQLNFNYTPTNNITLNFFDSTTALLMNGKNVTLKFIGLEKFNGSTSTGVYTTNSIASDTYTIVYNSDGYEQNTYIVNITWGGTYNLSLYMVNDTADIVEIRVEDKFGNPLDGAVIKIQKYLNNEWVLEQIVETDELGRTLGYYIPNTQYYNHIIEYNGLTVLGEINSDADKMIILDTDVLNGITFRVDVLGTGISDLWYNTFGVDHQLTYINTSNTTGYFRFLWTDPGGNTQTGCITVEFGASMTNVCTCTSTLSTTATGDVTCTINQSTTQRDSYKAVGLLKQSDTSTGTTLYVPVETLWKMIGTDTRINWGTTGLIIGFLVVLITIFAFIRSPAMAIYVGTGAFVGLALLGVTFRDVSFGALMVIVVIGYLIASLKSEGGLNA